MITFFLSLFRVIAFGALNSEVTYEDLRRLTTDDQFVVAVDGSSDANEIANVRDLGFSSTQPVLCARK